MKRVLNGYIITYIIDIALTFICMMLLIYYSLSMSIGWPYAGSFGGFQFDLAQLWLIIFLSILLIVSLFALVIYLIITVKQSRKQKNEKKEKNKKASQNGLHITKKEEEKRSKKSKNVDINH